MDSFADQIMKQRAYYRELEEQAAVPERARQERIHDHGPQLLAVCKKLLTAWDAYIDDDNLTYPPESFNTALDAMYACVRDVEQEPRP